MIHQIFGESPQIECFTIGNCTISANVCSTWIPGLWRGWNWDSNKVSINVSTQVKLWYYNYSSIFYSFYRVLCRQCHRLTICFYIWFDKSGTIMRRAGLSSLLVWSEPWGFEKRCMESCIKIQIFIELHKIYRENCVSCKNLQLNLYCDIYLGGNNMWFGFSPNLRIFQTFLQDW